MTPTVPGLFAPLDAVRSGMLRACRGWVRPFIVGRDLRVASVGTILVVTSLALTLWQPLWLLALGPVLLGVPHVVSDIRYLVVRRGWHRKKRLALVAGGSLIVGAATASSVVPLLGLAALAWVAPSAGGRRFRQVAATVVGLSLAYAFYRMGDAAEIVFAHVHNFIAVVFFLMWRRRDSSIHGWPIAAFVVGCLAVFIVPLHLPNWGESFGLSSYDYQHALAPGLAEALGLRLVLLFAFAQAVHYTIWLRLVPEEDRAQATPRTFVRSYRMLEADLGRPFLAIALVVALAIAGWATLDLAAARDGYLRAARFHGHLELYALTLAWVHRSKLRRTPA